MSLRRRGPDRAGSFSGNSAERAIIDIGSNSVRLVVYGGTMRAPLILLNEKVVPQLGREIATTGRLPDESIDLAMRGLRRFALLLKDLGVDDVETVATAATRDATNGPEFLAAIRKLGFKPRLLSGDEEASVSADGVIGAFPGAHGTVADLGGGSLELVSIANGASEAPTSLPLGTLRLCEYRDGPDANMRHKLADELGNAGWARTTNAPLFLVGGTWRAIAAHSMSERDYPLTDPHAYTLDLQEVRQLAEELSNTNPDSFKSNPRITAARAAAIPDAANLLLAMLDVIEPSRVTFSSWGLREGLLYGRLANHQRAQDPLLAGVTHYAAMRGAPPQLAARVAGWTVEAVPTGTRGSERVRLAATMLALASMQTEPNLRIDQAIDWALHKRWLALDAESRAMMAATVSANGNRLNMSKELAVLAPPEALDEAVNWGLAIRLARRVGARSRKSFQVSRLQREEDRLILRLQTSHQDLYGVPVEKDMAILADRLGCEPHVDIVGDDEVWVSPETDDHFGYVK
ncbi:MAG: Ppx/GppA family phosphatase [Sphingomonadales bacterium]|nr:MAG: Ppx/GppA family phosphatase [Sphingomonadales bacterium]